MRGKVAVEWKKEKGLLKLRVNLPANTTATVYLPTGSTRRVRTNPFLRRARFEKGAAVFDVGSGDFEFETAR